MPRIPGAAPIGPGASGRALNMAGGGILTLIICERSPASASSSTMLSSLSSMNESKYLITLGWFSCCKYGGTDDKRAPISTGKGTKEHLTQHFGQYKPGGFGCALSCRTPTGSEITLVPKGQGMGATPATEQHRPQFSCCARQFSNGAGKLDIRESRDGLEIAAF